MVRSFSAAFLLPLAWSANASAAPAPTLATPPTTATASAAPSSSLQISDAARLTLDESLRPRSVIAPAQTSSDAMWRMAAVGRRAQRLGRYNVPTVASAPAQNAPRPFVSRPRVRRVSAPAPGVAAFGAATLNTSPTNALPTAAPQKSTNAVATSGSPATATSPAPVVIPTPNAVAPLAPKPALRARRPSVLSSRERDRRLLASLDADLMRADHKLNRAQTGLSEGQRQLQQFTGVLQQAMMLAGPDAKGLHPFVRVAQRYIGTPYVWGGESARGFDCSGMIIRVMRDLGYKTPPHSAALQFNYGMPIAQELLKPGDLVFFKNTYKPGISHVGIYMGRRQFIQAAGTGIGTIVSSLDSPKYQAKYAGARRLVAAGN